MAQVRLNQTINLRELARADVAQRPPEREHGGISQAIVDVEASLPRLHKSGVMQHVKVLRGVRDAERRLVGQFLHRALALGEQIEQLQPLWAGERFPQAGKLGVQLIFELTMCHRTSHTAVSNRLSALV